jgi:hypothetical protein
VKRLASVAICLAVLLATATHAAAEDSGPRFRRTTPRAALADTAGALVVGIPGGRAWGIESELRPLPPAGTTLIVRLAVTDDAVREAFVRVAYYATADTRTRQLAITDSRPVHAGERALVAVPIDPPAGAAGYRVRVLARLFDPAGRSDDDAVTAFLRTGARPAGSLYTRLLP